MRRGNWPGWYTESPYRGRTPNMQTLHLAMGSRGPRAMWLDWRTPNRQSHAWNAIKFLVPAETGALARSELSGVSHGDRHALAAHRTYPSDPGF
jgi:hypothetical protein